MPATLAPLLQDVLPALGQLLVKGQLTEALTGEVQQANGDADGDAQRPWWEFFVVFGCGGG